MSNGTRGVLQSATTSVDGLTQSSEARIMLDNGADNSYVLNEFADRIGAKCVGSDTIWQAGFGDAKRRSSKCKIYEFQLALKNGGHRTIQAYGTNNIVCSINKHKFDVKKFPILTRVELAEPLAEKNQMVPVQILVGSDYYYDIVKSERIPLLDGLVLLDSELGYILAGRTVSPSKSVAHSTFICASMPERHFELDRYWSIEELGMKEKPDLTSDEISLQRFNEQVRMSDPADDPGHYQVKWPLKDDHPDIPDNFNQAFCRLKSFVDKSQELKPEVIGALDQTFKDQQAISVIEEAPSAPDGKWIHYLPWHTVIRPDKATTKVRVVYDASSKANRFAPSLNDCVHRGPVLLEDLAGLLLRFRAQRIGIVSDVEKAFWQISLQKEDRDLVRFLWLRDPLKPCTKENLVLLRFRRVCFGVIASPFLLAATLTHHLKQIGSPTALEIMDNIYVDNVIATKSSTCEAKKYYDEAKAVFNKAEMNLREWFSNDPDVMKHIPVKDRGAGSTTKVLGLNWDLVADSLSCSLLRVSDAAKITKRFVLQSIAKVYDPCGWFTPVTSPGKWLMQELWQRKLDWDDPVTEDLANEWKLVLQNLMKLHECSVPRCYGQVSFTGAQIELHAFCDASKRAYCGAVYLVVKPKCGTALTSLVFSKSRVAPLKKQTIPKLELIAATVGSRILKFVCNQMRLPVTQKYVWSDSHAVLHWILGRPVSLVFVRNRVNEMKAQPDLNFRYVPSEDNPADIPTRGLSVEELKSKRLWWYGPPWLANQERWPDMPNCSKPPKVSGGRRCGHCNGHRCHGGLQEGIPN